jgi:hypothetical protein
VKQLSILIPTVDTRRSLLSRLLWTLEQQLTDEVEVLVYDGWIPVGDKVTSMLQQAKGTYVMVVDDDDLVAGDLIEKVLQATETNPDYIAFKVLHLADGKYAGSVSSSIHGDKNWAKNPYGVHHKCPVRTEIAKQFVVTNEYRGDRDWSVQVQEQTKTEVLIDKHLYIYDYWSTGTVGTVPSEQNKNSQRDVGEYPYNKEVFTWLS